MKSRNILLVLVVFFLGSGLFLFGSATVRQTNWSSQTSASRGPGLGGAFSYSDATLTPDNPPRVIVGTTGTADLILLKTPFRDFSDYVCHRLDLHLYPGVSEDCAHFGGGNGFNNTILDSYLQTHQSQIVYSQTIADQNVTLNYPVTSLTEVTIVLAQLGSHGTTMDYWQYTTTNQTVSYPLLGYSERPGAFWTPTNMSMGLLAGGVALLVVALIQFKGQSPEMSNPDPYRGSATRKCPQCGQANLFFAAECNRCGFNLSADGPRVEVTSH